MFQSEEDGFNENVTITLNSLELASVILATCALIDKIESGQRDYGQIDEERTKILKSALQKIVDQAKLFEEK